MLAYNKLGRLRSSPVGKAGNKVKDIDMKMKTAQLPDMEETLLRLLLWAQPHINWEPVINRQNNGPQSGPHPNAQNVKGEWL